MRHGFALWTLESQGGLVLTPDGLMPGKQETKAPTNKYSPVVLVALHYLCTRESVPADKNEKSGNCNGTDKSLLQSTAKA